MARSTSESEGEILEGVENQPKVPKAQQPLHRANEVDLASRQNNRSLHLTSPSPSPPSIYHADRSDRSISPASQSGHARKKMRYDTSGYQPRHRGNMNGNNGRPNSGRSEDTRRHVPHYEDPRSQRGRISYDEAPDRRADGPPRGSDHGRNGDLARGRGRGRNHEQERPGEKRRRYSDRSRSRSPYYRGRERSRSPFRRSRSRSPYHAGKQREEDRAQHHEASLANSQKPAQDNRIDYRSNNISRNIHRANPQQPAGRPAQSAYSQASANRSGNTLSNQRNGAATQRNVRFANGTAPEPALASTPAEPEPEPEPEPVDEAAEVEKRRLRREAIKARLKSQQVSTLSQELSTGGESRSSTPAAEATASPVSRSVSPAVQSPATPQRGSGPGSPFGLGFPDEDELANHATIGAMETDNVEQSAADYDPTADMQEERFRGTQRPPDASSAAFDELKQPPNQTPLPAENKLGSHGQLSKAPAADDGDDDYDMFDMDVDESKFKKSETTAPGPRGGANAQAKTREAGPLNNFEDSEGYYRPRPKEIMNKQYEVIKSLGTGVFSTVCQAEHISTGRLVAIKIVRNNDAMQKGGLKEIDILQRLNEADPEDKKHIVRYQGQFDHMGRLCMVFESLHENLRDLVKRFGRHHGLSIKAVRSYGRQIFLGLSLLKKCGIVHADLKPDNIIVTEDHVNLKICDFGTARETADNDEKVEYIASRFYRAPEVMIGLNTSYPFDMWSIGCTLYELYTGNIAFNGASNNQMLKLIMECRGKISMKLLKKGLYAGKHFEDDGQFRSSEWNARTGQAYVRLITFTKPLPGRDLHSRIYAAAKNIKDVDLKELDLLVDLLDKCLHLNPEKRITPNEALHHPFFTYNAKVVNLKSKFKAVKI